ncbi:protein of unknown function DUF105 [Thermodesulfatator indicus DSM 15286]|uniref:Adenosylcobinamide amidohydrolase n=1 Tax=Thermodesulfatator indicus (strain DSM 15286 / JCM 11887 / CIR29812) TaxID=667014 RepID=F8ACZ3_THEID|nr:adenosylcobinamide amidohydrolase [Thermodesulfatator indicus]AEH45859.1 protein of unknown function DUF105 [Thermodesulfatator indicus DSM 15286]
MPHAVKLFTPYAGLSIFRGEKIIYGAFEKPHTVISTCRVNGGIREDIEFVANHQACEPRPCPGEKHGKCLAVKDPQGYHWLVCEYHGLPPEKTVLLGTAANMNLAGFSKESFDVPETNEKIIVFCVATAGVETNAGRAGDPSQVFEWNGKFFPLTDRGTINILLFINQELAPCALVRAVIMATEAKTAVLQELNVPSRYSKGLATGTGTDQIAIAALKNGILPLRGAGKHVKLGELLAKAVKAAVREALARQNKRTPESIRYAPKLLERFGLGEEAFFEKIKAILPEPYHTWLHRNRYAVLSDTGFLSAVLAFVHLLDQHAWGVIPEDNREALLQQGALVAVALSGKDEKFAEFKEKLSAYIEPEKILLSAVAFGFQEKWQVPYYDYEGEEKED